MLARLPLLIEVEAKRFVVVPTELLLQQLAIVHLHNDAASARIEIEISLHRDFQCQPIISRVLHPEGIGNRRRFVVGERQQSFPPIPVPAFLARNGAVKPAARNRPFRHHFRHSGHRLRHNRLRRHHILLQKHRRHREHVTNVIEAITGVIRRELDLAVEVNAHEVADRVAILDAVQPAGGDTPRIRVPRINAKCFKLDPLLQPLTFFRRRLRFFGWRHEASPRVFQRLQPEIVVEDRLLRLQLVKRDPALVHSIAVTVVTILREQRLHVLAEVRRSRRLRPPRARTQQGERQQANQSRPRETTARSACLLANALIEPPLHIWDCIKA